MVSFFSPAKKKPTSDDSPVVVCDSKGKKGRIIDGTFLLDSELDEKKPSKSNDASNKGPWKPDLLIWDAAGLTDPDPDSRITCILHGPGPDQAGQDGFSAQMRRFATLALQCVPLSRSQRTREALANQDCDLATSRARDQHALQGSRPSPCPFHSEALQEPQALEEAVSTRRCPL